MPESLISPEMQRSVGREIGRRRSFPIERSDIRRWAVAVYYPEAPPPRYWDEDHETTIRNGGIVAPEEFNPFAWMSAEGPRRPSADGWGPELVLGVAAPPTSFMLNGGVSTTYGGVPMRPGDVIESVTRLKEYRERPGRLGQMLFTVTEDLWTNQRGDRVRASETTIIRY